MGADDAESTSVKLKSKQEDVFEVEKEVACRSITVKNMVDDTGLDAPVPLPMVDSKILIKVIEYCKYHHKAEQESLPEDEIKGKTPEEIRIRFNIKNDFTPEEEEEVKRE